MVITAKRALFVWLLAITGTASIPITCAVSRAHPAPCVDTADVVFAGSVSAAKCSPGAHITVTPSNGNAIVTCTCPRKDSPDAHDQDR